MRPSQSSLYRELELLMLWAIPVSQRVPNIHGLRVLSERMINDISDCLSACTVALDTADPASRLEPLDVILAALYDIKSITKTLHEWSVNSPQKVYIITKSQRVEELDHLTKIGYELRHWRKKTEQAAAGQD